MKKRFKPFEFKIDKDEMIKESQEFKNQPKEVLEQLRLVKILMAIFIPLSTAFTYFESISISIAVALVVGIAMFLIMFFKLKLNVKLSLIPLICIAVGFLFGLVLVPTVVNVITSFSESNTWATM